MENSEGGETMTEITVWAYIMTVGPIVIAIILYLLARDGYVKNYERHNG
jgi:hypothetical protein